MDWINKINRIIEKMKTQFLEKGIDSLDKVFITMAEYDKQGTGKLDVLQFEPFLSKIGVFLKTQELSEIHKYLGTYENGYVNLEQFVGLLKNEVPELLIKEVKEIFAKIKDPNGSITLENLKSHFNVEMHPRVKLMKKEVPLVQNEFEISFKFILGDKTVMTEDDFLELHKNMFWVTPKENTTYFFRMLPGLWGLN